jgi:cation:H+ antiporter
MPLYNVITETGVEPMNMHHAATLILGVIFAALGGELFVRGAMGVARRIGISPGIVAATVAAFATSSPELSICIGAALQGAPEISLGDALGSNIVNVALVFAIPLLAGGLKVFPKSLKNTLLPALMTPVITGLLVMDGQLSRMDGLILLSLFLLWLFYVVAEVRKQRSSAGETLGEPQGGLAAMLSIAGMALLLTASHLVVTGARGIATALGVDEFIIGSTIVALGTSTPELATVLISRLRGHDEIGLGTVLGSNVFNGLLIVGTAVTLSPLRVARETVGIALAFGFTAVLLTLPWKSGSVGAGRGIVLLCLYAAYVFLTTFF